MSEERTFKVDMLTRVEGEGRFWLKVDDGKVTKAQLSIFEAPRFFEAFLQGRSMFEVPDIVARICGICPIAYQLSATRALEDAIGFVPTDTTKALRRLLYCGEWIESHVLHVFLLHAPDFLGYASAVEMAADHREIVQRGLRLKRAGNAIIELLGGRAIHPVSVCVGGFTRVPRREELTALRAAIEAGLGEAEETVAWAAGLPTPDFEQDYVFVALQGDEYPLQWGDSIAVTGRDPIAVEDFDDHFVEQQVEHSNALQCRLRDGTAYLTGPMARLSHFAQLLHPRARAALDRVGLAVPVRNPYRSIVVRAIEVVHAFAEALDIIDAYRGGDPAPKLTPKAGQAAGATEAPRGICWHRYHLEDDGTVAKAQIVPPTSQNQARIEQDLVGLAPDLLAMEHDAATLRCEQLIRSYDPCISCATHFLRLDIERGGAAR